MINVIFFGINVILLIVVWNFMLKKSILDHYRDQLFDLREEVREFFIKNEIPLDSPAYKNLRDLFNAHLRFTEKITFMRFIFLEVKIQENKELQLFLKAEIEKQFDTTNPKLKEFIPQIRGKAKLILLNHMVNSSGLMWLLAFIVSPGVILWNLIRMINLAIRTSFGALTDGVVYSLNRAIKFVFTINAPVRKAVKQDLLEECSFRIGADCAAAPC